MLRKTFISFITEQLNEVRYGEYQANLDMTRPAKSNNMPFGVTDKKEDQRKMQLVKAAERYLHQGQAQMAYNAVYKLAYEHAKEDRYSDQSAKEIAERKTKTVLAKLMPKKK